MVTVVHRIEASLLIPGRGEPIVDGVLILDGSTIAFAGARASRPNRTSANVGSPTGGW